MKKNIVFTLFLLVTRITKLHAMELSRPFYDVDQALANEAQVGLEGAIESSGAFQRAFLPFSEQIYSDIQTSTAPVLHHAAIPALVHFAAASVSDDLTEEELSPSKSLTRRNRIRFGFEFTVPAAVANPDIKPHIEPYIPIRNNKPGSTDTSSHTTPVNGQPIRKKYPCGYPRCSQSYPDLYNLTKHICVHLKLKLYKCTVGTCDHSSTQKGNLKRHIDSFHPGRRDMQIPEPSKEALQEMERLVSPYLPICKTCECVFETKEDLTRHNSNLHSAKTMVFTTGWQILK